MIVKMSERKVSKHLKIHVTFSIIHFVSLKQYHRRRHHITWEKIYEYLRNKCE